MDEAVESPSILSAELLLRPGRSANAFEETVQRLLQSIRLGLIGSGERLPAERELATLLDVSRDTLREALAALADAGYVAVRRGRYGGTFVVDELPAAGPTALSDGELTVRRNFTQSDIDDIQVLRDILEVGAARAAASRELSAVEREQLWRALLDSQQAGDDVYRRADSRLHLLIAELTGSPSLVPLVADMRMQVNELLDQIPLLSANIAHSNQQHEDIVKAILRGHPNAAAEAMTEHIAGSEALLHGFLD